MTGGGVISERTTCRGTRGVSEVEGGRGWGWGDLERW